jgi:hypothetical protein
MCEAYLCCKCLVGDQCTVCTTAKTRLKTKTIFADFCVVYSSSRWRIAGTPRTGTAPIFFFWGGGEGNVVFIPRLA